MNRQPISMPKITQYALETTGRNKLADVAALIVNGGYERVMVFCNTKYTTVAPTEFASFLS